MAAYSKRYYDETCHGSRASAEAVVPLVLELVSARSVIDLGCGLGSWLAVFQEQGVEQIIGVDGDWVPLERLEIPPDRFRPVDLTVPLEVEARFDLAISLEVAEHLPEEVAPVFVDSLTRLAPAVLFAAAIPSQGGVNHVNERWPDYWAALFRERGYLTFDCVRPAIWEDEHVDWWYAQNTLLFVHPDRADVTRLLAAHDPSPSPRRLVHPRSAMAEAEAIARELSALVPLGSRVLLVGGELFGQDIAPGSATLPFLGRDGVYFGSPADSDQAIAELERERAEDAELIVFARPVFWWLAHYAGFARHLRSSYECLVDNDRVVVFDLQPEAGR